MKKIKIKNMFWDGHRSHNTEQVEIDLSNGETVKIGQGDEVDKVIKILEKCKGGK